MKKLFLLLIFPALLFAEMLKVGESIEPRSLNDQFDRAYSLESQQNLVVTWDKASTQSANIFFDAYPQLLENNTTAMLVDVSTTPSGIMSLFVLPKMRSFSHPILLSYDKDFNLLLPYKSGYLTLLRLKDRHIIKIEFIEDEAALKDAFE